MFWQPFGKNCNGLFRDLQKITSMSVTRRNQSMKTTKLESKGKEPFADMWINAAPYSAIPGPTHWEMVRIFLPGGALYKKRPANLQRYLRERYGDVVKIPGILGDRDKLLCFDPKNYEIVYRTEGVWPIRRGFQSFEYFRTHVRPDVVGGLVFDQGETWANLRQIVGPMMMKPEAIKSYVQAVDEVTRDFVSKVHTMRDANLEMPSDFGNEVGLWAVESIGAIALDRRLGVLSENRNKEADLLIKALRYFADETYGFDRRPSTWRFYKTKKFKMLMDQLNIVTDLIIKYIDEAVEPMEQQKSVTNKTNNCLNEDNILQKLLRIDRKLATITVFDMVVAGIDSTAAIFEILLYQLATNPEKQSKLHEEVFKLLPRVDSKIKEDDLFNAPYLRACFKESMRMEPVVPVNLRSAGQDIILNGYQVPKMTDIVMKIMSMDDLYFIDSKKFMPERWLRDNNAAMVPPAPNASPFAFLPFGFGPRSCIGRRFAEMEVQVLTLRILREFRVEWHHEPIRFSQGIFTAPSSPLRYRLIRHDNQ